MDQNTNNDTNTTPGSEFYAGTTPETEVAQEMPVFNRDAIRQAILDAKSDDEVIEVFGVKIEIRSPDLEGLLQYKDQTDDDRIMARSIINTCFVPGTDEPVFDQADAEALMKQKFSKDMRKLIKYINACMGGAEEVETKVKDQTFRTS